MGVLYYGRDEFEFDDRVLAHLQVVITTKLRRRETFCLSWAPPVERGSGRNTIWIDNGIPIRYYFNGSRVPAINREWLEEMMASAIRPAGLIVGDEPVEGQPHR